MKLLSLDFDGVLHSATDPVMVNFRAGAPAWQLEVAFKAQGRFVWAPELAQALECCDDMAIIIHSTWRRRYDDATLRSFLPDVLARRVIMLDGQIDRQLDADAYVDAALDLIAPASVCVMDDRPEFFAEGRVQRWMDANAGQFLWCTPQHGVTDPNINRALVAWCQGDTQHPDISPCAVPGA